MVDNEEAIAYGLYMGVAFIIVAALVLAAFAPMINSFVDYSNTQIDDGTMSVQTKGSVQWNLGAFTWLPVFTVIGLFLWVVIRALEQKRAGG
jgi:large-conductance mechanosensitive channel